LRLRQSAFVEHIPELSRIEVEQLR